MRRGRPIVTVRLTESERQQLDSWAHRSRSAPHLARRARIIQACAAGRPSTAVAKRLHPALRASLLDEPRPGTPRRYDFTSTNSGWDRASPTSSRTKTRRYPDRSRFGPDKATPDA